MPREYPLFFCPSCNQVTEHSFVNKKEDDIFVKCHLCDLIHKAKTNPKPDSVNIDLIITIGQKTIRETQCFDKNEIVVVGGFMSTSQTDTGKEQILTITSIEVNGNRVNSATAKSISTIWAKDIQHVALNVYILDGITTIPIRIATPEDRNYEIDQIVALEHNKFKITQIELNSGKMMSSQGAKARDIKSLFGTIAK